MPQLSTEYRLPPSSDHHSAPAPVRGSDSVSLSQFVGVLRRRYKVVLGLTFIGALGGGYLAWREPPTFRAGAVLRLAGERRAMSGGIEMAPGPIGRTIDPQLSMVELVRSRSVLGAVVDTLGLQLVSKTPEFARSELNSVSVDPRAAVDTIQLAFTAATVTAKSGAREVRSRYGDTLSIAGARFVVPSPPRVSEAQLMIIPREVAVDALLTEVRVTPRKDTDIIDVAYASTDPRIAQQVVNATVRLFQMQSIRSATEQSRQRRIFLDEQLTQMDSMLAVAQAQLSSFRSRQQMASSEDQLRARQEANIALDARRDQLESDRRIYGAMVNRLNSRKESEREEGLRALAASPEIVANNPTVGTLYQQLANYQTRLDSLTTGPWRSTPNNPDVVQLRSLINSTESKLREAFRSHVSTLDAHIAGISSIRARSGARTEVLPAMAEEEARLNSRVLALSKLQDQLREEFQKARIAEALEAGDVAIVDVAGVPYAPLWATATLKLMLGLLLGLVLGLGLAFILETLNTSIRRPEDLESMLHLPGLAVIPSLTATPHSLPRRTGLLGRRRKELSSGSADGEGRPLSQPFSVGTEAFRMLRTSLIWSDSGEMRTIVVTSAAPGEGKTVTAANLSVAFAHDGFRVLLIDCDVRRPRLHSLFRMPRSPGLMELLTPPEGGQNGQSLTFDPESGRTISGLPIDEVVRATNIRGLSLLTCGSLPTNASNLLSGLRMRALLRELAKSFDLIILDTPPVLATADAGILSGLADGVLLVVRAGRTDRNAAQRAHQQLSQVGARIVGAVLNDPGGEVVHFGDYYYPYDYAAVRD
jgi:succinoglycan biosynthesis transport protein ExoP